MKRESSKHRDSLQSWLVKELRTDHAGETGAVAIYDGILAVTRNSRVREFASQHRETERQHLALIEEILPPNQRSWLLPLWRLAGFLTGAIPACIGSRWVFATIAAVETFVEGHYKQQIQRLADEQFQPGIREVLEKCRQDELAHRDEAAKLQAGQLGPLLRLWCCLVGSGSNSAVALARWV